MQSYNNTEISIRQFQSLIGWICGVKPADIEDQLYSVYYTII